MALTTQEAMQRLIATLRAQPDNSVKGRDLLRALTHLSESELIRAIHGVRRQNDGTTGQLAVNVTGFLSPTEYAWTKDNGKIARTQLRHRRYSYAYALHDYWAEHQKHDRLMSEGAPYQETATVFAELRVMRDELALAEARIVALARSLGHRDRAIGWFFRNSPNDPVTAHGLV